MLGRVCWGLEGNVALASAPLRRRGRRRKAVFREPLDLEPRPKAAFRPGARGLADGSEAPGWGPRLRDQLQFPVLDSHSRADAQT